MRAYWKLVCILLVWAVIGLFRMRYEAALAGELSALGLQPVKLKVNTRDKIGQTSSAVALGGLRTLVATFLNLRAFTYFGERKWDDVAQTFEWMVDLAPRTRYYWETGSWHQAYNASASYLNDSSLPFLRRREAWRASILAGKRFLERGVQNNPEDWRLWANLGFLLVDSNKRPAFADQDQAFRESAEAYRRAYETGNAPEYVRRSRLYSLARVSGAEADALELARTLAGDPGQHMTPTAKCVLFVLESWNDPDGPVLERAVEVFGSEKRAYDTLGTFWMRTSERFPTHGVPAALELLERKLGVPESESILKQSQPPVWNPSMMLGNP